MNTSNTNTTDLMNSQALSNGSAGGPPLTQSAPSAASGGAEALVAKTVAIPVGGGLTATPSGATAQIAPPPATANIPAVPKGFVKPSGTRFAGILPNRAEISRFALATSELSSFSNYAQTFGTTAPPYGDLLQLFQVTNLWTTMRTETDAWRPYAIEQEGLAWTFMRAVMAKLAPAFQLALAANPQLALQLPNLSALLGAKKAAAKKSVATKAANNAAVSAGHAPLHGKVGKSRKKAAEKSAYLAATAHALAPTPALPAVPPPTPPIAANGISH